LADISKMAVSPRREKAEKKSDKKFDDSEKTPKNRSVDTSGFDLTPPVRDPGPSGSSTVVRARHQDVPEAQPQSKLEQVWDRFSKTEISDKNISNKLLAVNFGHTAIEKQQTFVHPIIFDRILMVFWP
jgi:hypothetical protein